MFRLLATMGHLVRVLHRRQRQLTGAARFASHGRGFWFDPDGAYTYGSIHVGEGVTLGSRPVMIAALSEIHVGDHVMFGPGVTVIGGAQHNGRRCLHEDHKEEDRERGSGCRYR